MTFREMILPSYLPLLEKRLQESDQRKERVWKGIEDPKKILGNVKINGHGILQKILTCILPLGEGFFDDNCGIIFLISHLKHIL